MGGCFVDVVTNLSVRKKKLHSTSYYGHNEARKCIEKIEAGRIETAGPERSYEKERQRSAVCW